MIEITKAEATKPSYLPSIGSPATKKALGLMKKAGVKPVFHGYGAETSQQSRLSGCIGRKGKG